MAEQVMHNPQHDAVVLACFGDPGLDAAREAMAAPVQGIAGDAFRAAAMLATGCSVVTTMSRTCVIAERLLQRYGFERNCRGIHGADIPVLALETCGEPTVTRIEAAARQALAQDRGGAIVLGCAGMAAPTADSDPGFPVGVAPPWGDRSAGP